MPDLASETSLNTRFNWLLLNSLVIGFVIVLIGPITLGLAAGLKYFKPQLKYYLSLICLSALLSGLLFYAEPQVIKSLITPFEGWLVSLCLFPLITLFIKGWIVMSHFLKPKSLQEQLNELEKREEQRAIRDSRLASSRIETAPAQGMIRLGARIRGDVFPDYLGVQFQNDWIVINESVLDQHLFVLGTTGAGKSETIKRLVYEVFNTTDRHLFLVDGKGDEELANEIRSLSVSHGRGLAPVFRLGFDKGGAIYDGFKGQATDIFNRLCALIGTSEAEGAASYYADINRDLLQMICYAPDGPPRNFEELRKRISHLWLKEAYKDDEVELEAIEEVDKRDLQGLLYRIRPLAREFSRWIGEEGFSLENTKCAVFSLRAQSVGDTAERFLDFLIEDLKDFIGKRQTHPSVLIIDEFGQFSNENITALLSLARSSKLSVILATQDVASLKDEVTKKLVLANTRTKLLMASDFPQDVAELAGTIQQIESSMQHDEGEATGMGSARKQHAFRIDMNEAARLQPGEAFLIRQRYMVKLKVKRIGDVPAVEPQQEEVRTPTPISVPDKRPKKRPRSLE